jgi:hypothetical protein
MVLKKKATKRVICLAQFVSAHPEDDDDDGYIRSLPLGLPQRRMFRSVPDC